MSIEKNIKKVISSIHINLSLLDSLYVSRRKNINVEIQKKYAEFFIPFEKAVVANIMLQIGYLFDKDHRSAASFYKLENKEEVVDKWVEENKILEKIKEYRNTTIAHFDYSQDNKKFVIFKKLKSFVDRISILYRDLCNEDNIYVYETSIYKEKFNEVLELLKK